MAKNRALLGKLVPTLKPVLLSMVRLRAIIA